MSARRIPRPAAFALLATLLATLILALAPTTASAAPASRNVNDFSFSSWRTEIDATVERGAFGGQVVHSKFTETITAEFPDFDQNRGITRGIPVDMGGQTMRIEDVSVTDGEGNPVPYETEQEFGANDLVLLLGDDNYVHGSTTYVIEYTLVNTLAAQGDYDPYVLYAPNLSPPSRYQDVDEFSAQLRLDAELWDAVQQQDSDDDMPGYEGLDANCYVGLQSRDEACDFTVTPGSEYQPRRADDYPEEPLTDDTVVIDIAPFNLGTSDVTFDMRLDADKVQLPNFFEKLSGLQQLALGLVIFFLLAVIGLLVALVRMRKPKPLTPIIARYSSEIPPAQAATILRAGRTPDDRKAFSAHVLEAAVQGAIVLEEDDQEKGKPLVRVHFASSTDEVPGETRKFRHNVLNVKNEGDSTLLVSNSERLAKRWRSFVNSAVKKVDERGWAEVSKRLSRWQRLTGLAMWLLILSGAFVIWRYQHVSEDLMWIPLTAGGLAIVAFIAQFFTIGLNPRDLTPEGREALTELYGLRDYLELAEEDRLRALQNPDTAERVSGSTPDATTVLHVYERLLPYAVLFGMSDEWAKLLELKYEEANTSPSYVSGRAAGIMWANQQLHTVNPTYVAPSSGSGSGFSGSSSSFSGGGSAGGGFGGGSVGGR